MSFEQEKQAPKSNYKKHESARQHIITFILSIVLTALAFIAVMTTDKAFALPFLVVLAIIQVLFQLFYWMHLSQKGHKGPLIGILTGSLVTLTAIVTAVYWMWW